MAMCSITQPGVPQASCCRRCGHPLCREWDGWRREDIWE